MINLQDFHVESVHPPNVSVEDKVIHILPIDAMLVYGFWHYYAIQYAVHFWIVWIWLHQEWGPVKLHRGIIILEEWVHVHRSTKIKIKSQIKTNTYLYFQWPILKAKEKVAYSAAIKIKCDICMLVPCFAIITLS